MSQDRIEAAAMAAAKDEDASNWHDEHEYYRAGWCNRMAPGIAAADALMFSEEAIERVAVALWNHDFPSHPINDVSELLEWTRGRRLEQARLLVAALKGEQP
jgi:hypothetical protein